MSTITTRAGKGSSLTNSELDANFVNLNTDKLEASLKDASGGFPGLTLFKLNLRNALNTFTSWFTTSATASRTWTMPDKDGTVAMLSDITGTNSGINTGDNASNSLYADDYRASNFIAGTNYLAPNGSAANLTNFPTLNQNTTGNAATATTLISNATVTTPSLIGVKETKIAMAANDINLAAGNLFTKTISGATTLTVSNVTSTGLTNTFVLELTNGGSAAITWWAGMKWAGGTAPTLTAVGVDILGFYTHDGGTIWRGLVLAKDSK